MRKKWSGVLVAAVVLATGFRAAVPAVSETVAEESGTAKEEGWAILEESLEAVRQEMESSLEEKEESLEAASESVQAAEESLEAQEESLLALEESLKEAEEAAGLDGKVAYGQLIKSPSTYQQKVVGFSGRITRVARSGNTYGQLVVAVNGDASQKLVCEYDRSKITPPLAVGDQVQVSGLFTGILQYRLDSGHSENLPTMTVEAFEQIWRAAPETAAQPTESQPDLDTWVDAESSAAGTVGSDGAGAASGAAIPGGSAAAGGAAVPGGTTLPDGSAAAGGAAVPGGATASGGAAGSGGAAAPGSAAGPGGSTAQGSAAVPPTESPYMGGPGMVTGQ